MQQLKEKSMEKLVEKLMNEISTEKPSLDFTSNLMKQLNRVSHSKSTTYQPLISKTGWLFIVLIILALFGFVILRDNNLKVNVVGAETIHQLYSNMLQGLSLFKFSIISFYAIILTTLMLFVQIGLLLYRYQKKLGIN